MTEAYATMTPDCTRCGLPVMTPGEAHVNGRGMAHRDCLRQLCTPGFPRLAYATREDSAILAERCAHRVNRGDRIPLQCVRAPHGPDVRHLADVPPEYLRAAIGTRCAWVARCANIATRYTVTRSNYPGRGTPGLQVPTCPSCRRYALESGAGA